MLLTLIRMILYFSSLRKTGFCTNIPSDYQPKPPTGLDLQDITGSRSSEPEVSLGCLVRAACFQRLGREGDKRKTRSKLKRVRVTWRSQSYSVYSFQNLHNYGDK